MCVRTSDKNSTLGSVAPLAMFVCHLPLLNLKYNGSIPPNILCLLFLCKCFQSNLGGLCFRWPAAIMQLAFQIYQGWRPLTKLVAIQSRCIIRKYEISSQCVQVIHVKWMLRGYRAKLIVGLPQNLTSFRIISSENICSANKTFANKCIFGTITLYLALFGPS